MHIGLPNSSITSKTTHRSRADAEGVPNDTHYQFALFMVLLRPYIVIIDSEYHLQTPSASLAKLCICTMTLPQTVIQKCFILKPVREGQ